MPRRHSPIRTLRSFFYGLARPLGDVRAVRHGPEVVGRRLVRRGAGVGSRSSPACSSAAVAWVVLHR
jgi:hypothetical protein